MTILKINDIILLLKVKRERVLMLTGNQMANALVNANLAEPPKQKPRKRGKKFACHRCGNEMRTINDTNVMVCTNEECSNFYVFDK